MASPLDPLAAKLTLQLLSYVIPAAIISGLIKLFKKDVENFGKEAEATLREAEQSVNQEFDEAKRDVEATLDEVTRREELEAARHAEGGAPARLGPDDGERGSASAEIEAEAPEKPGIGTDRDVAPDSVKPELVKSGA